MIQIVKIAVLILNVIIAWMDTSYLTANVILIIVRFLLRKFLKRDYVTIWQLENIMFWTLDKKTIKS